MIFSTTRSENAGLGLRAFINDLQPMENAGTSLYPNRLLTNCVIQPPVGMALARGRMCASEAEGRRSDAVRLWMVQAAETEQGHVR